MHVAARMAQGQSSARRHLEARRAPRPPPAHRDHRRRADPRRQAARTRADRRPDPLPSTKACGFNTIEVDAEKSAAGLLGPGDRVDVQLFVRKDDRTGVETAKSKVILQNIRVFAVDQAVQRAAEGGEEKKRSQNHLADAHARASQQALARRANRRDQPHSSQPRRRAKRPTVRNTRSTTCSPAAKRTAAKKSRALPKNQPTTQRDQRPAERGSLPPPKPVKEPFRMEIVEAQGVREVLFDGETGRPDSAVERQRSPLVRRSHAGDQPARSLRRAAPRSDAAPSMLDRFPDQAR